MSFFGLKYNLNHNEIFEQVFPTNIKIESGSEMLTVFVQDI